MARGPNLDRESLKQDIIFKTRELATQRGMSAINIRTIAAQIGCSVGTIYNIFKNLDDLMIHLNAITLDEIYELFKKQENKGLTDEELIKQICYSYIDYSKENYNLWSLLFEYKLQNGGDLPDWYESKIDRIFEIVKHSFKKIVKSPKEAEIASKTIWAGIHGICQLSLSGKLEVAGVRSMQTLADSLINNYLSGIHNN